MQSARSTQNIRRMIVLAALVAASAAASTWRTLPNLSPTTRLTVNLVPPIFTSAMALSSTGCTGTPTPNDPNLGGTNGVLAIEMKSIKLVDFGPDEKAYDANNTYNGLNPKFGSDPALDNDNKEFELLSAPTDLNFAGASGTNVGTFASNVSVPVNCTAAKDNGLKCSYEGLKITVNPKLRIKCAVVVSTPGSCGTAPVGTYVTKGGSSLTDPDSTTPPAQESSVTPSGAVEQSVLFAFSNDFNVTPNSPATKNIGYAAGGACELWDIDGGQFKIMPKNLSASIQ